MRKRRKLANLQFEPVKFFSDYQRNWDAVIPPVKRDKYVVESTSDLSIHGDAPKCFLRVKEHVPGRRMDRLRNWPKFIAKVGSKWYPLESITEHALTRIGQCFGFQVANSRLRRVGPQVRFLSEYFLRGDESLTHGIETLRDDFGQEMVEEIAHKRWEREFYTFAVVVNSLKLAFPLEEREIVAGLVGMLLFDAIVGNNDRHPANWGVITSARQQVRSKFSPIFDTARGLFWNSTEEDVRTRLRDSASLEAYIRRSQPQIGWEGRGDLNHFDLLNLIARTFPEHKATLAAGIEPLSIDICGKLLEEEFGRLFSSERIALIRRCLALRIHRCKEAIGI